MKLLLFVDSDDFHILSFLICMGIRVFSSTCILMYLFYLISCELVLPITDNMEMEYIANVAFESFIGKEKAS